MKIRGRYFTTHKASSWGNHMLSHADVRPVYLQNKVLREILPRYGIVFLPLEGLWAEDAETRGRRDAHGSAVDVSLERVGETFLTRLDYVLRYLE